MAAERRIRSKSEVYHLVCRGSGKQILFEDDRDRCRYRDLLFSSFPVEGNSQLLAWCLMDNHVHLLVEADLDEVSTRMHVVNSTYAHYFNSRYERVDHLFQGRFKSEPIETNEYLLTVLRYIHQNPVKAGMTSDCWYAWSSYPLYQEGLCLSEAQKRILMACGGGNGFKRLHEKIDYVAACKDVDRGRKRIDDSTALELANSLLVPLKVTDVASLDRGARNSALARLRCSGLSVRQIERLTGVPKSVVSEAA